MDQSKSDKQFIVRFKEWLHEERLGVGDKIPAERILAEMFNVSRGTVRATLERLESDGIIRFEKPGGKRRVIIQMPQVDTLMSSTVAILTTYREEIPESAADYKNQYTIGWERYINLGATMELESRGLNVLKLHMEKLRETEPDKILRDRFKGLLVMQRPQEMMMWPPFLASLTEKKIPVVMYGNEQDITGFDRVISDHDAGTYALTQWLIRQGKTKILRVWMPYDIYWLRMRNSGYERAMKDAGLEPLPPVTIDIWTEDDFTQQLYLYERNVRITGGRLIEYLAGDDRVEAIIALNDGYAYAAAAACRLFGLHPNRDIMIVGYDNFWRGSTERKWDDFVPAATVDKHNPRLGQEMVRLLMDRIEGRLPTEPQLRLIKPDLVIPTPE